MLNFRQHFKKFSFLHVFEYGMCRYQKSMFCQKFKLSEQLQGLNQPLAGICDGSGCGNHSTLEASSLGSRETTGCIWGNVFP